MHDALAPGGVYLTVSLHRPADVVSYFDRDKFNWRVACYNIRNPRWVSEREFRGSCAHTLIVCCRGSDDLQQGQAQGDKEGGSARPGPDSVLLEPADGVLSDDEYASLCAEAEEVMRYATNAQQGKCIGSSFYIFIHTFSLTSRGYFEKSQ
jgi:hypothetical protein